MACDMETGSLHIPRCINEVAEKRAEEEKRKTYKKRKVLLPC